MAKSNAALTGHLQLEIDEQGLTCHIRFRRASDGEAWTVDRIVELLREKGVKEGYSREELGRQVKLAVEKNQAEGRFLAARGLAPEDPIPEQAKFESIALPKELQDKVTDIAHGAAGPDIVVEKIEKIKTTKTVPKKGALPFMGKKEEVVEVVEKQISHERVYVDPTVEEYGYAEKGTKLATIEQSTPGVPGRSIFGDVVAPRPAADPFFYTGKNVSRQKTEIVADVTGIVRIGRNWVDILPFRPHRWSVELSDDMATCFLRFTPGDSAAPTPNSQEIMEQATAAGCSADQLLTAHEIATGIQHAVDRGGGEEHIALTRSDDSYFSVDIDAEKMRAVLTIRKGRGKGRPLVLKEVGAAIKAAGLKGLNYDRIREDLTAFYKSPELALEDYLLAEGKRPKRGPDRPMDYSVRFLADKDTQVIRDRGIQSPEILGDIASLDVFPIESVEKTALVEKDQRLITIPPPVAGDPGVDVHGTTVPGIVADEPAILLFENVERKQNVIISTLRGVFEMGTDESGAVLIRVREHEDARVQVDISPDKMRAYLSLSEGSGTGEVLDEGIIHAALERAGVRQGVKESVVAEALSSARTRHPVSRVVIAEGKPPRNAESSTLQFLVDLASGTEVTIRGDGTADFKNRDTITSVAAGAAIAEIRSDTEPAEDGWDVTGATVTSSTATGDEVELGPNIRKEEPEPGRIVLIAETGGELLFEKGRLEIRSAHTVNGDVGMKTGNIKFSGSVHVSGGVDPGFYVMSDGEVKIAGNVGASLLSASENIVVQGGVRGAGKAALRSKRGIQAAFVEQSTLLSVEDILLKSALMQCNVKCNGKVKLVGDGGRVVGGRIRARLGLETSQLGSPRGVKTQVSFGQDYLIGDRIEIEEREIGKLKSAIAGLDTRMRREGSGTNREDLEKMRVEKLRYMKIMEKRNLRLFTLRERFEEHNDSKIIVKGTVFPGVVIESHGRIHEIAQPKKGVIITFDQETGRIVEEPIKGSKD